MIPDALHELFGFIAIFLAIGAAGFYVFVVRRVDRDISGDHYVTAMATIERGTAVIGLIGSLMLAVALYMNATNAAAESHKTIGAVLSRGGPVAMTLQLGGIAVAIIGFLLALRAMRAGWWLAAIALTCYQLRGAANGQFTRLVNPVHVFAGALWIGTLFSLFFGGIGGAMRTEMPKDERGKLVARLVSAFSPLALSAVAVLALMGVITAFRHLDPFSSLWTTSYGWALIIKLVLVLLVLAAGYKNWRDVGPSLGADETVAVIRRSAGGELAIAGLVLVVTAVLVSLPSPREAHGPRPGAGGPPPAGAPVGSAPTLPK